MSVGFLHGVSSSRSVKRPASATAYGGTDKDYVRRKPISEKAWIEIWSDVDPEYAAKLRWALAHKRKMAGQRARK